VDTNTVVTVRQFSGINHVAVTVRDLERSTRETSLFMGVHNIEGGVSATEVAGAHEADLATQGAHGVNYLRYWVDE
jgi:hypothetical protein